VVSSTINAASLSAAGQAATAGVISAQVAALAEGVLKPMLVKQLKPLAALVLGVIILTGAMGVVVSGRPGAAAPAHASPAPSARADEKPVGAEKKDADKPEVTPGALARVKAVDLTKPGVTVELLLNGGKFVTCSYLVAKDAEIVLADGKKATLKDLKDALVGRDNGLGAEAVFAEHQPVVVAIRVFRDQAEYDRLIKKAQNDPNK
jgi:hypothetical protein